MPTRKLAKWQILISEFDIMYITHKSIKGQDLADYLAENSMDGDYKPLSTYFLDEKVLFAGENIEESYPGWRMFFDGATSFKGIRNGAVLILESVQHYPSSVNIRFPRFRFVDIPGPRRMVDQECQYIVIPTLCEGAMQKVHKDRVQTCPRIQNEFIDALATLSFMIQYLDKNFIDPIKIEIKDQHAYCFHVNEEPDGKPWYHDKKRFLKTHEYPENDTNGQK
ncbi:uncharacterized protein LOC142172481 [Nicotiana tabacum]|uniref:Uncharacterized protein LOC142172481 n=1 Tax=Nicotiana tabacum TaxID=4097 RepID=A0AC58T4R6_TOBAC